MVSPRATPGCANTEYLEVERFLKSKVSNDTHMCSFEMQAMRVQHAFANFSLFPMCMCTIAIDVLDILLFTIYIL